MAGGKFITFEGGEGSGKSTQSGLLAARLRARGLNVLETREPGGTALGEEVRKLILAHPASGATELLLFAAARAEHVAVKILPALEAGQWVICDRFLNSSRVYQGLLGGADAALIEAIEWATIAHYPDLTLIFDLPVELGLERAAKRGALSRYDAEPKAYHEKLRRGFLEIAEGEPERCVVIDASGTVEGIEAQVWRAVEGRLLSEAA